MAMRVYILIMHSNNNAYSDINGDIGLGDYSHNPAALLLFGIRQANVMYARIF